MQGVPPDDLDTADFRTLFRTFLEQHLRETHDGAHWSADLVTHIRQELALGSAGGLGVFPGMHQFIGELFALGDVANVALNDIQFAFPVNIADEFHGYMPAVAVLQWM